jgi:MerR family transcriptional regulator, copper efflux regulator
VEPIEFACTIDPAGRKQRVDQLASLSPQVLGLRRDGLTLALEFQAEAAQEVQAFVVEESRCCPFFSFEIDELDHGLRLGIRTPPGGEAMLDALQAGFAGDPAELRASFGTAP